MNASAAEIAKDFRIDLKLATSLRRALVTTESIARSTPRAASEALELANKVIGGHGTEGIRGTKNHTNHYWFDTVAIYVNTGDTYSATILYDTHVGKFSLTTFGDFVERKTRAYGIE